MAFAAAALRKKNSKKQKRASVVAPIVAPAEASQSLPEVEFTFSFVEKLVGAVLNTKLMWFSVESINPLNSSGYPQLVASMT